MTSRYVARLYEQSSSSKIILCSPPLALFMLHSTVRSVTSCSTIQYLVQYIVAVVPHTDSRDVAYSNGVCSGNPNRICGTICSICYCTVQPSPKKAVESTSSCFLPVPVQVVYSTVLCSGDRSTLHADVYSFSDLASFKSMHSKHAPGREVSGRFTRVERCHVTSVKHVLVVTTSVLKITNACLVDARERYHKDYSKALYHIDVP